MIQSYVEVSHAVFIAMASNPRGEHLAAHASVMMALAAVAIILRFWSRALPTDNRTSRFWWDDWTALAGLVGDLGKLGYMTANVHQPFSLITLSLGLYMVRLGLGKHFTEIPPENVHKQLKALYGLYICYDFGIALPKTSAAFFYMRIFGTQTKSFKYALWITHFLILLWFLFSLLFGVFQCNPVRKHFEPELPGHCVPTSTLWLSGAIPSVIIDFLLLVLPLPMLWRLKMKMSRRILIMMVFVSGYW